LRGSACVVDVHIGRVFDDDSVDPHRNGGVSELDWHGAARRRASLDELRENDAIPEVGNLRRPYFAALERAVPALEKPPDRSIALEALPPL
jgi:hypothetical protein